MEVDEKKSNEEVEKRQHWCDKDVSPFWKGSLKMYMDGGEGNVYWRMILVNS